MERHGLRGRARSIDRVEWQRISTLESRFQAKNHGHPPKSWETIDIEY